MAQRDASGGAAATGSAGQNTGAGSPGVLADRRTVSRGAVVVTVRDLTRAATQVRDLAATHGGFVSQESIGVSATAATDDYGPGSSGYRTLGYESPDGSSAAGSSDARLVASPGEAMIVLRVKPDQTRAVMDAIAKVGTEDSRWSSDTDVENTLVDLESRIQTKAASVADLRALLAKASSIGEIIQLENEISTRTADLESMKAQKASLDDAVAYSNVTAILRTSARSEEASENGFVLGLKAGWQALVASLRVLLIGAGALLPFAVVLVLIGWPARRFLAPRLSARRERRRAARAAQRSPEAQDGPVEFRQPVPTGAGGSFAGRAGQAGGSPQTAPSQGSAQAASPWTGSSGAPDPQQPRISQEPPESSAPDR